MQRSTSYNCAAPVRARPGPGTRPAVETPLEQELKKTLHNVQRNLRGQVSANNEQQLRIRDLQLLLKQKDLEIQDLKGKNQQLLEDKTAIMDYGKKLWREREQEVAQGLVQVKTYIEDLQEQNDSLQNFTQDLQEQLKLQTQCSRDSATVQELESAYTMIQELEETLKLKNYHLEMLHLELHQASDAKERIKHLEEQVEKLKAEQTMATAPEEDPKEVESSKKLKELQQRLEELEETLLKKESELQMFQEELTLKKTLKEQVDRLKAECLGYKQCVNDQLVSLHTTINEQKGSLEELYKEVEQYKEEKLTIEGQLQEAAQKNQKTIKQLREQVETLQAEQDRATQLQAKEDERSQRILEELNETLKKKDLSLEMLHLELAQASEAQQTIEHLRELVEKTKAECQSQEQASHTQQCSLQSALAKQRQSAAEAERKVEELERNLQLEQTNIQSLKRDMESQKETFEEVLKGFYASYGALMEDKKHQEEKVKELSAALHSCEAQSVSVLHRYKELQSRAEDLQLTLDQKRQKKRKGWFKFWQ